MKKILFILLLIPVNLLLQGETVFIHVEEYFNEEGLMTVSNIKEGLLDGLFENGHIVFDDLSSGIYINWKKNDFNTIINTALKGGANYLIAVNVVTHSSEVEEDSGMINIKSELEYYIIDVRRVKILYSSSILRSDTGSVRELDADKFGFSVGIELSGIVAGYLRNNPMNF